MRSGTGPKQPKKHVLAVKDLLGDILERPVQYKEPEKIENQKLCGSKVEAKVSKFKSGRKGSKK